MSTKGVSLEQRLVNLLGSLLRFEDTRVLVQFLKLILGFILGWVLGLAAGVARRMRLVR